MQLDGKQNDKEHREQEVVVEVVDQQQQQQRQRRSLSRDSNEAYGKGAATCEAALDTIKDQVIGQPVVKEWSSSG